MRRSTFALAAVGVLIAAAALPLAIVAVMRDRDSGATTASMTGSMGMEMGSSPKMSEHMAPAPSAGVPGATAVRGGTVLRPRIQNGVWKYELTARPVKWPILPGVRVTVWRPQ